MTAIMRPSAVNTTRPMPWPPYGVGSVLPLRSRAIAPTSFQVPTMDAIRALLSDRQLGADRQAPQHAPLAMIVVDREMLATAIVPDRDRALLPAQAGGEFRPGAV